MSKTFMALCDELKTSKKDFISFFTSVVQQNNIDVAVLIGDNKIIPLLDEIRDYYEKEYSEVINLNVCILNDIIDPDYMFDRIKSKINEYSDSEITLNITHGSSRISAISIIVSKLYGLKVQQYCKITDTSKLKKFDVVEYSNQSNKPMYYIKRLFNSHDYKMANDILEDNYDSQDKTKQKFSKLITLYGNWDNFKYDNVDFEDLSLFFTNLDLEENIEAIRILSDPKHEKHASYRIADMLNNSIRRIREERYVDAIIRLYRVLELISEMRLYEGYGIRKNDVHINDIDNLDIDKSSIYNIKKRLDFKYPHYQIPLTTTFFILQKLNDDVGLYYSENKDKYQELFQRRNISVLVHGRYTYDKDVVNEMLIKVLSLALRYDENIKEYMIELQYPQFKI